MTSLPVLVLVLGIGIVRYQSIGYWVLGVHLGIILTLLTSYWKQDSDRLFHTFTTLHAKKSALKLLHQYLMPATRSWRDGYVFCSSTFIYIFL